MEPQANGAGSGPGQPGRNDPTPSSPGGTGRSPRTRPGVAVIRPLAIGLGLRRARHPLQTELRCCPVPQNWAHSRVGGRNPGLQHCPLSSTWISRTPASNLLWIPSVLLHQNPAALIEFASFGFEQRPLQIPGTTLQADFAPRADDPLPGNAASLRYRAHRPAYSPGSTGFSEEPGNLTVARHFPPRNLPDEFVDLLKERHW